MSDALRSNAVIYHAVKSDAATSDAATSDAATSDAATSDAATSDAVVSDALVTAAMICHAVKSDAARPVAVLTDNVVKPTSRAALSLGGCPGAVACPSGKLRRVLGPLMARAALSYSRAASSAVSKVPSHKRTFLLVSRISAAYFPHGLSRTPRYLPPNKSSDSV